MEQPQICIPQQIVGSGSTCEVLNFQTKGLEPQKVIKLCKSDRKVIEREAEVLKTISGEEGFPAMYSWQDCGQKSWIVMEKLGISLKSILENSGPLPAQWVVKLGLQMLARVEVLHEKGYLHIDLKPEHFLFGLEDKKNLLHLIDFGMSQKISQNSINQNSFPKQQYQKFTVANSNIFKGNISYSSVLQMMRLSSTTRDQLSSLVYIIAEMLEGSLPWGNLGSIPLKKKYHRALQMKQRQEGWKRFGWWVRDALNIIQKAEDPYYGFRLMIIKLVDLY